jgi:hypothetical protein
MINAMSAIDLTQLTDSHLLEHYAEVMQELQRRGITRSTNNPVANLAERLVVRALSLKGMPESTKGYDAIDAQGRKYEIKGRRPTQSNQSRQLSFLRELDKQHFDFLAGVLFNENMTIMKACLVPHATVLENSRFTKHGNAWIFYLRDSVWAMPGVRNITKELKQIENIETI